MVSRPVGIGALVLLVVGVLALLLELQSPVDTVFLTGRQIQGSSVRGLVYYSVDGIQYTIVNPQQSVTDTTAVPTTVFVDPARPGEGRINEVTRWIDLGFVGIWPLAAVVLLIVGAWGRARSRRTHPPARLDGGWAPTAR